MIYHGDLFDVLPTLAEASIDACVTDPPYGIGFMGKTWDTFKPADVAAFRERTVKDHKAAKNPNLKGRKQWAGGAALEYDYSTTALRGFQGWCEAWGHEVLRVLKPGAYMVVCGAPRSYHRMASGLEDAGFEVRDCFAWLFGSGFPKSRNLGDGKGTALKPAYEPIVLAWKPFRGTITACHEQHGTAALNLDACRIETTDSLGGGGSTTPVGDGWDRPYRRDPEAIARHAERTIEKIALAESLGRWPANVLLDEEAAALLDEQTGVLTSGLFSGKRNADKFRNSYGEFKGTDEVETYGDSGGASRFYYVAKPSREERDYGTEHLTARKRDEGRKEGNPGGDNPRNRGLQPRGNFHPTVKPVELMRWLVKLVTPIGGTVLDPFTGSGTTGMACAYELRPFIGIEREADYVRIAEARIKAVAPLFVQEAV